MYIHENEENFRRLLLDVSNFYGVNEAIIEKNYYVVLFLQKLSEKIPTLLFTTIIFEMLQITDKDSA